MERLKNSNKSHQYPDFRHEILDNSRTTHERPILGHRVELYKTAMSSMSQTPDPDQDPCFEPFVILPHNAYVTLIRMSLSLPPTPLQDLPAAVAAQEEQLTHLSAFPSTADSQLRVPIHTEAQPLQDSLKEP